MVRHESECMSQRLWSYDFDAKYTLFDKINQDLSYVIQHSLIPNFDTVYDRRSMYAMNEEIKMQIINNFRI